MVTGANHGIGLATAAALAEAGFDVCASYLRNTNRLDPGDDPSHDQPPRSDRYHRDRAQGAEEVTAAVTEHGRRCLAIEADLTDVATPTMLFDRAESGLGPVSVLVHNASGWRKDSFSAGGTDAIGRDQYPVEPASIDLQLQVDARAGALLMQEFITRHRSRGATRGRIVTLTSGEGRGFPGEASYGAAKAALISYTLTAAAEMAADGVTANVIYPPVTDTGWVNDDVREFVARDHEHHHVATPDEVADVIRWLCADAGRIVTGNIIRLR